jgi:NAD(P)-dependent dehydrogenase (short-subunit alcohol dehydrogenase family)
MRAARTAVVLGASGGLGSAVFEQLANDESFTQVFAVSRRRPADSDKQPGRWLQADCTDPSQLAAACEEIGRRSEQTDLLINCSGMLHLNGGRPEKSLRELETEPFGELMRVNALAPLQALQIFMPLLRKSPAAVAVTLSAMVGSITDNQLGGWYSYRMSKAALNMGLRNAAIEASRYSQAPVIVALHPGTTLTDLSAAYVSKRPHRSAQCSARHILAVVAELGSDDSGKFFNWDGKELPW